VGDLRDASQTQQPAAIVQSKQAALALSFVQLESEPRPPRSCLNPKAECSPVQAALASHLGCCEILLRRKKRPRREEIVVEAIAPPRKKKAQKTKPPRLRLVELQTEAENFHRLQTRHSMVHSNELECHSLGDQVLPIASSMTVAQELRTEHCGYQNSKQK
jgi:hypothetical protein